MKLHEMKQKRNTIATDMRALHDKIGDTTWTEEQRTQWNAAKSELDALDVRIAREDELRRQDQNYVDDNEKENRHQQDKDPANPDAKAGERRAAAFDRFLRHGFSELSAEERQAVKELRAQGTSPDAKGGYTVPTQMLNKIVDSMKAYGGIASVAQILNTSTGQDITWSTSDGTAEEGELLGENTETTEEDVTFGTAVLGAKKLSSKSSKFLTSCYRTAAWILKHILHRASASVLVGVKLNIWYRVPGQALRYSRKVWWLP